MRHAQAPARNAQCLELEREPPDAVFRVPAAFVPLVRLEPDAREVVVLRVEPDAREAVVVLRLEVEVRDGLRDAVVLRVPVALVAAAFRMPVAFVPVVFGVPVDLAAVVRPELVLRLVPVVFFAVVPALDRVPVPRAVVLLCVARLAVVRAPVARVVPVFRAVPVVAFFAVVLLARGLFAAEAVARDVVRPDVVRLVVDFVFADAVRVEPLVVFRGVGAMDIPLSLADPLFGSCVPPGRLGSSFGANPREHESDPHR